MTKSIRRSSFVQCGALTGVMAFALLTPVPSYAQETASPAVQDARPASVEELGDLKRNGPTWVRGQVTHISAIPAGLLISFGNKLVSANCRNSGSYNILIAQNDVSMTNFFMAAWTSGKRKFKIYTHDYTGTPPANPYALDRGSNYCTALQIDTN